MIRNNWTKEEAMKVYKKPLMDLVYEASVVHRGYHNPKDIIVSTLISVRTGKCNEDCAYCAQSSHYDTGIQTNIMLDAGEVIEKAKLAKESGAKRVCLSTSGKKVSNKDLDFLINVIKELKSMDLKVCCTLGTLDKEKAQKLADAGLSAYNHNIDTSEEYYDKIVTTRTFQDRLDTLKILQETGIPYCSGGIIGLGETEEDRVSMLCTLANMDKHPFSLPINSLIPIPGTKLEENPEVSIWEIIRMVATARIMMPKTNIELAAGRVKYSEEGQALCYMAGANSIFLGDKLLTTKNNEMSSDVRMFESLGLNNNIV